MMRSKWFVLLVAVLATASLWGCGSNGGSGGSSVAADGGGANLQVVGSASCEVCHGAVVALGWTGSAHDDDAVAGCEGCHGKGSAHRGTGPIPVPSPSLNQCDNCHDVSLHKGDKIATSYQTTPSNPIIEGYVLRDAEPEGCRDCHGNVHSVGNPALALNIEINEQWALSGHAGKIASATPETGLVWGHYDWDASNRASCARCHTATGAMNFLNSPAGYVAANNDFSHLTGWTPAVSSQQNELLFCWGCHSDVVTGDLRNPGAITETYDPAVIVTYPDIGPSNVCMGCHLGRETGEVIMVDADVDGDRSFINSHYLTAGATLFNESGYEYAAGGDYDSLGFHKNIGVADILGTGTNGPCVACHMTSTGPHTFSVSAASTVCASCHDGLTDVVLEEASVEFAAALEELNLALQDHGIYFGAAYPYFFTAPYVVGGSNTAFTNWESVATALGVGLGVDPTGTGWKNVMGAAFNYNLLEHDPGAFAHNKRYALKLIADSIDFLNDGAVDGDDSLAAEMLTLGLNITNDPGYNVIHDAPVAAAVVAATAAAELVCTDCHTGAPHFNPVDMAQFMGEDIVCADCHAANDVTANPQILADYVVAGHADVAGAWSHEEDGATCSRCHTASGYIADFAAGSYSYPNAGGSNRLQVLACAACHTDLAAGTRRVAAAYTAIWSRNSITASVVFPDVADSNLCIRCHSARRAGANVSTTATTTAHYLPAATIVFGGTVDMVDITANTSVGGVPLVGTKFTGGGYEFAGESYAGLGFHKNINTGTDGPCVACHMSGTAGHTWNAVTKDETTGDITAVLSTVCTDCHGASMTAAHLNTSKAAFELALDELEASLNARSIYMDSEGDFYSDAAFTVAVDYAASAAMAPAVSQQDMQGASFNFWLFKYGGADQAAYVHNRTYGLNLIADSVDLLSDGLIDGDATVAGSQLP